jgi:hypothetical protein
MATPLNIYELDKFNPYDFFIPLTFSINDFRDISTRNGTYSKTVKIPGTKKNDSLLGHSFKINAEGFFDRNQRVPAIIEKDGIRYLDGSMQLKSIDISDGKNWVYNIILYSDLSDWGSLIKDKNIRDLNYDTFTYNSTNIESSWSHNGRDNGYTFPLINYGYFNGNTESDNQQVEEFLPSVFVYDVFRKIFRNIGYTLKEGFFARQEFRDLILPAIKTGLTASSDTLNENRVEVSSFYGLYFPRRLENQDTNLLFTDTDFDGGSNMLSSTYYVAPFLNGTYTGTASVILKNSQIISNNIVLRIEEVTPALSFVSELASETISLPSNSNNVELSTAFDETAISQGNYIRVVVHSDNPNPKIDVGSNNLNITPVYAPLSNGEEISIKDFVYDMRQDSFIKYFVQLFNLVHITNDRAKTVEFFHRDDFYKTIEEAEDWSEKIDVSKTQTIEQLDDKLNRDLVFEYEEDDNDQLLKNFEDIWKTNLTDDSRLLDNEFLKDEKKVASVRFSGSVGSGTIIQSAGGSLYLPQLINNFKSTGKEIELNPRLLIYEGLKDGNFTFESVLKTQYPSAYFIKRVSGPFDVSLSFKDLNEVDKSIQENDRGLVSRYYGEQIRQFNNARLYTAYMRLTGVDIVNLDFRKPKLINGVYYYLNKVEDYKAGVFESVKCEFIQIV